MSIRCPNFFPKSRLEGLTDGVYAVALTLLVLDLKLPSGPLDSAEFLAALTGQIPNALAWLLSFWVILIYWESQVRLTQLIDQVDSTLLKLDLLHLALISLLPFSTALVSEFSQHSVSVAIYTANLWMISALGALRTTYVRKHPTVQKAEIDCAQLNMLMVDSKRMVLGMSAALAFAFVIPGWNLLAIMVPKLLPKPQDLYPPPSA